MRERRLEKRAGRRLGRGHQVGDRALRHHAAAAHAGCRTDVDQVRRAPDRVFVVLDDDQRVALGFELLQRVEQDAVVARVQADRRLVEHVGNALQVGTELRGEADALRFAAGKRRRGAVEREVAEADLFEERKPRADLGQRVARDLGLAACERQPPEELARVGHRLLRQLGDRTIAKLHRERGAVQALAVARVAGDGLAFVPGVPPDFFAALLGVEAGELQSGAETGLAPAVLAVVGEEARVRLGKALPARRAGALGREALLRQRWPPIAARNGLLQRLQRRDHASPRRAHARARWPARRASASRSPA